MGRSGTGSGAAGVVLAAAAIALGVPATAGAALTKPERKAVDIRSAVGGSTSSVTFSRIGFKGDISNALGTDGLKKASVTFALVPESGPTTTITSRRSSRRPVDERTGTDGRFDLVRDGDEIVLLVEDLPAPTARLEVTTAGPVPEQRAASVRKGTAVYEFLVAKITQAFSDPNETTDQQIKTAEEGLGEAQRERDEIEERIEKVEKKLANAENARAAADTKKEADEAQRRIEKHKAELDRRKQDLKAKNDRIAIQQAWIDGLRSPSPSESTVCANGVDDNDPEDTIADHPNDPGCLGPADNDEKDEPLPVTCPAPGQTRSGFSVINTPQSNSIRAFSLRKAGTGQLVLEAPVEAESAPPAMLPGEICGGGVNVTYEWRQYTDGDPFGFPDPPPGDRSFRIVIFADNPSGSGNPGGQDATLNLALGTTPQ